MPRPQTTTRPAAGLPTTYRRCGVQPWFYDTAGQPTALWVSVAMSCE